MSRYLKGSSLRKILGSIFLKVDNRSLKESSELWKKFNQARIIRKNAIHPWVKHLSEKEARNAEYTCEKVMKWIMQNN